MRTITLIILAVLAVQFSSAALITSNSALNVSLLYYEPVPVHPGDEITVWIQIENSGGQASNGGTLTILPGETFTVPSESQRTKEFPRIPAQESFLAKVRLQVSKDANEGENTLRVRAQQQGSENAVERDLTISIQGRTSVLELKDAVSTPSNPLPGEEFVLELTLENIGATRVRNVQVMLDLADLSIAPASGSNTKTVSALDADQSRRLSFPLVSFPDATAQAYKLPVTISYEDERGNNRSLEKTVGVTIGATPELLIYFDEVGVTTSSLEGEVVIRLVNKGLAEIKLLELEILEDEHVEVLSESPLIYVGNIDEDDYESAEMLLRVDSETTQVPIRLSYRDALNRPHEEQRTLTLRAQPAPEQGNGAIWFVVIAIVVIAGIWYLRRRRRRK